MANLTEGPVGSDDLKAATLKGEMFCSAPPTAGSCRMIKPYQLFIHTEPDVPHFPFSPIPTCFLTGSDSVIVGTGGHVSDPL